MCSCTPFQPRPPPRRKCTWSVSAPPASRWVGRLLRPLVATETSSGTLWPIRRCQARTSSVMRSRTFPRMCPATCWKGWRSGRSTRCGSKRTQTWVPARRAAAPASEPKKTVMLGSRVLQTCSPHLLTPRSGFPDWTAWMHTSLCNSLSFFCYAGVYACCSALLLLMCGSGAADTGSERESLCLYRGVKVQHSAGVLFCESVFTERWEDSERVGERRVSGGHIETLPHTNTDLYLEKLLIDADKTSVTVTHS